MKEKISSFYKDAADAIDVGLRKYMLNVFAYMSIGLALTALVAYFVSLSESFILVLSSPVVFWMISLVPLGISIYLATRLSNISVERARVLFLIYAASLGVSLSLIFNVYSGVSIVSTFFVTSSMFLSMVIYGYITEKDLTGVGSFLMMCLIGLIISSIVNMFIHNSTFAFITSAVGVVIFTGLTAYDTQVIKSYYFDSDLKEISEKKAIFGALRLYLDFINLFLSILRFTGGRRKNF
ncbi:MAG: Bax inhibitor-1/YccA family protein [Holosporaceae bacterium]|jgi:FtsH-binding integral membrane protein|nr:Bax inhibitor-1/YccA family protein [Holosporaceae bacterium]